MFRFFPSSHQSAPGRYGPESFPAGLSGRGIFRWPDLCFPWTGGTARVAGGPVPAWCPRCGWDVPAPWHQIGAAGWTGRTGSGTGTLQTQRSGSGLDYPGPAGPCPSRTGALQRKTPPFPGCRNSPPGSG